jgi:hypothetical protein
MKYETNLLKMRSEYHTPVKYFLPVGDSEIFMNELIGRKIEINYLNQINCIKCNAVTQKSFHQGYCYSCYISVPECDSGVLRPETDMSHLGISRDIEWSKKYSLINHYVYLAITGDLKVGVTRFNQIPNRWIDQGAISAIKICKTPYRNLAGIIEVELKKHLNDKTNVNKMLKTKSHNINLITEKQKYISLLPDELKKYITTDNTITNISYPYNYQFDNFSNFIFSNKQNQISGILMGIKGQYLIFNNGIIFNVRAHSGYLISLTY